MSISHLQPPQQPSFRFIPALVVLLLSSWSYLIPCSYCSSSSRQTQSQTHPQSPFPLVANTWPWTNATEAGYHEILDSDSSLSAIVAGCSYCERHQCDTTVGYGGSPDSTGNTTLDAMIMYGPTHDVGSVANLRNCRDAIAVARAVLDHSEHTMLSGFQAGAFAAMMGFDVSATNNLTRMQSPVSIQAHAQWLQNDCQPNFWKNVVNQSSACPPYQPINVDDNDENDNDIVSQSQSQSRSTTRTRTRPRIDRQNHDTIGMIAVESDGVMSVGTSTNGAANKIAGRVGDSPIVGSGAYVEQGVGAAVGTGDGDVMMRFAPTFAAVQLLELGYSLRDACVLPLLKIVQYYPAFAGGMLCIDAAGNFIGTTHNMGFEYAIRTATMQKAQIMQPIKV